MPLAGAFLEFLIIFFFFLLLLSFGEIPSEVRMELQRLRKCYLLRHEDRVKYLYRSYQIFYDDHDKSVEDFQGHEIKFVYFNMINIALFVKLLEQNDFIWNVSCSNIVILLFLFNLCLYYLHDEIDRTHSQKTPATYLMPAGFGAVIYALMTNMTHLVKPENIYFLYAFLVFFVTVLAFSTAQVWYAIKNKAVNRRINYTALLIPLVMVLAALFSQNQGVSDAPIWLICAVGVFVFCLIPASVLRSFGLLKSKVRDVDLF